jgi:ABC-2 type transport system permease protein
VRTLLLLIRREYWEHRVLWSAPLVLAAIYLLLCMLPTAVAPGGMWSGQMPGSAAAGVRLFVRLQVLFAGCLFALLAIVEFFYLTDCLYAERRDRSILFWKSLPVSDSATVLSKLLVAVLVTPLGVLLLAIVVNTLAFGALYIRLREHPFAWKFMQWDTAAWLRLNGALLLHVPVLALWYAPLAGYQLLVSAWARSSVFVWTVLPLLALSLAERFAFGSWDFGNYLMYRILGGFDVFRDGITLRGVTAETFESLAQTKSALQMLARKDLWIGVAVAAGFVFAAIRIRRYRDDT